MTTNQHADTDICDKLIDLFKTIETERMDGIPMLNEALSVDAVGFDCHEGFHLGVLLTPWFMNLVMIPSKENEQILASHKVGSKQFHSLPAGQFEFIVGHEEALGKYLSCSLFSPVFEFADQETAMQAAQEVLQQVTSLQNNDAEDEDADMREIWAGRLPEHDIEESSSESDGQDEQMPKELSRRELLRGLRKSEPENTPERQS